MSTFTQTTEKSQDLDVITLHVEETLKVNFRSKFFDIPPRCRHMVEDLGH